MLLFCLVVHGTVWHCIEAAVYIDGVHCVLQAEIEVSDEEEIADPEVDNTVRGKGGRKTGGRQTGTADAVASAAKLQQASLASNTATLFTLLLLATILRWHARMMYSELHCC